MGSDVLGNGVEVLQDYRGYKKEVDTPTVAKFPSSSKDVVNLQQ